MGRVKSFIKDFKKHIVGGILIFLLGTFISEVVAGLEWV
jgi:hypothetical protein